MFLKEEYLDGNACDVEFGYSLQRMYMISVIIRELIYLSTERAKLELSLRIALAPLGLWQSCHENHYVVLNSVMVLNCII